METPAKVLSEYTLQQQEWLSLYLSSDLKYRFNGTQCAFIAYGIPESPRGSTEYNHARQNGVNNKKAMNHLILDWLNEVGLGEATLKAKLAKLMNGSQTKFIKLKGGAHAVDGGRVLTVTGLIKYEKDEKGNIQEVFCNGESLVALDVDDPELQRRALDMALKVKGLYAPTDVNLGTVDSLKQLLTKANDRARAVREETKAPA